MATNIYFSQGTKSEQNLYEDLIIESLKMYGQDVYYLPRELVNVDEIFKDDVPSRFPSAYKIEMYIENIEGFDGDGDLFSKFGVEIRDAATFIVARKRWNTIVQRYEESEENRFYRPREGDLIYLTLSGSMFEITKVEDESPFYQLKNLPVFKMRCELFEYSDEDFDTNISGIDEIEEIGTYQTELVFSSLTGDFIIGETVIQSFDDYNMTGEIVSLDYYDPNNLKVYVAHYGSTNGEFHNFTTTQPVVGTSSNASGTPIDVNGVQNIDKSDQSESFENESLGIIDFSENNPFSEL